MSPTRLFLFLMAVAVAFIYGCSDSPNQPVAPTGTNEFGGYSATDEAPAFNDPYLAASVSEEVEFSDPMAAAPQVESLLTDPEAGFYHLRIVWGRLRHDSTVTAPTDWSGSLKISRGAELIRRVIRFEPATDQILPRTDRTLIEWISQTTVHNDGIAVDLLVPPTGPQFDTTIIIVVDSTSNDTSEVIVVDTLAPAPVTVEFTTGPYTRTFSLREVAALDTIVTLDDSNAVALNGFKVERIPCPRGFLTGHWGYDSTGQGIFSGMWISKHGLIEGHLQGHFGEDTTGERIFYGKWIDLSGHFEGLLRGTWKQHPAPHADDRAVVRAGGWFRGLVYDAQANPIGVLAGHYMSAEGNHPGFLQGRWKVGCADLATEDDGMGKTQDGDGVQNGHNGRH